MIFPLEVVVVGKQDSACRSHIKYADNVDLKTETNDLYEKRSKCYEVLKKNGIENGLPMLELCSFLKRHNR
jgi:hypothetical protein